MGRGCPGSQTEFQIPSTTVARVRPPAVLVKSGLIWAMSKIWFLSDQNSFLGNWIYFLSENVSKLVGGLSFGTSPGVFEQKFRKILSDPSCFGWVLTVSVLNLGK